jgi:hypothetical protein
MNNEPVAWMDKETGCFVYSQYEYEDLDEHGKDGLIPLYTHPAEEQNESFDRTASHMAGEYVSYPVKDDEGKVCARCGAIAYDPVISQTSKELTDEEIRHIQAQCHLKDVGYDGFIMRFARAILRKAQDK